MEQWNFGRVPAWGVSVALFQCVLGSTLGFAKAPFDLDKYYSTSEPILQEVQDVFESSRTVERSSSARSLSANSLLDGPVTLDNIINLGKTAWQVIEAGQPVANVQTDFANALPQGVKSWEELENWQTPQSKVFRVSYQNFYGKTVLDFSYRILFTYGGSVNGKGKYLTHVSIVPANLNVSWGYNFSVQVLVPNVTNSGTTADPVGAAELLITWKLQNVLRNTEGSASYYVKGDGTFTDISGTLDPASVPAPASDPAISTDDIDPSTEE